MLRFGLIINPYAGIGGSVGLKGSDGEAILTEAFKRGATPQASHRTSQALEQLKDHVDKFEFITAPGLMGANVLDQLSLPYRLLNIHLPDKTTAEHTRHIALLLMQAKVDVLLFAGGDGTARDICEIVGDSIPVLGIPAGVKIHSGVYGITPKASGEVIRALLEGQLVDIRECEVRDLDEDAFRNDIVRAKHFGDMRVPQFGYFVQSVKQGGIESEALVIEDIAAELQEQMQENVLYLIGSGKTTQAIMHALHLPNTLLGVDAVFNGELIGRDLTSQQILILLNQYSRACAIISVMGGQGHIIGRGNQQFSADVLNRLGKNNIIVVSSKSKIRELNGRPLIIDSGDLLLNKEWAGSIEIITGYRDRIVHALV